MISDSKSGSDPLGSKNLMLFSLISHPGIGRPSTLLVLLLVETLLTSPSPQPSTPANLMQKVKID